MYLTLILIYESEFEGSFFQTNIVFLGVISVNFRGFPNSFTLRETNIAGWNIPMFNRK